MWIINFLNLNFDKFFWIRFTKCINSLVIWWMWFMSSIDHFTHPWIKCEFERPQTTKKKFETDLCYWFCKQTSSRLKYLFLCDRIKKFKNLHTHTNECICLQKTKCDLHREWHTTAFHFILPMYTFWTTMLNAERFLVKLKEVATHVCQSSQWY